MVTQLAPKTKTYTITEYLELEENSELRHEFMKGEILPMAGGTTNHNEVITNLCLLLKPILRQKGGKVYIENVRLAIPDTNIFTYPDVMVIDQEPIYYTETKTTITNPVIIIEVLSDATRGYDLGDKFTFYRKIETLQEYILIEPEQCLIMLYRKGTNKNWSLDILEEQEEILQLNSVNCDINLTDIYEGILIIN